MVIWDIYEIYCRMSTQAAVGVGQALCSAQVNTVEGGFHEEHLELLPSEVAQYRDWMESTGGEDEMLDETMERLDGEALA